MGAPGRTKIYEMFQTGHLKRISAGGRTLVEGDSLRALLLGDTPAAAAAAALPKAKAKAGTDRLTGTAAASASAT